MASKFLLLFIVVLACHAASVKANAQNLPQMPRIPTLQPPQGSPEDEARARIERDRAKKANEQRQEQLRKDTASLLKLATELQESVDKSDANVLSVDVVRKAEQIEKLAHSVKARMKSE